MWIRMRHYIIKTEDDLIHVQNAVMGLFGQHHVHTKEQFDEWVRKNKIAEEDIIDLGSERCVCGLKAGEVIDGCPK